MAKDVNDLILDGVDPVDLIRSAKAGSPDTISGGAAITECAEFGRAQMLSIVDKIETAQTKPDAKRVLADLLDNQTLMHALAFFWLDDNGVQFESQLIRIDASVPGIKTSVTPLRRAIMSIAADIRKDQARKSVGSGRDLRKTFNTLTIPHGLRVPMGWDVDDSGVWGCRQTDGEEERTLVSGEPIVITARAADMQTGEKQLEIAWRDGSKWETKVVPRGDALDRAKLVHLAQYGAPVHSGNVTNLVHYLADFEQFNKPSLEIRKTSRRMGWQSDNCSQGIIVGDKHHMSGEGADSVLVNPPDGLDRLVNSYRVSGSYTGWLDAIHPAIERWPKVLVGIYVAAAAPLVQVVGCEPFVFEWYGRTSTGKTTALEVAASVWGDPNGGIIGSWEDTATSRERRCGTCHSLPVYLDETKRCKNKEDLTQFVYQFASGIGKGRGGVSGTVQTTAEWNTVVLTTGEAKLTSYARNDGALGRVISLDGPPCHPYDGDTDKNQAAYDRMVSGIRDNHGNLGFEIARHLVMNDGRRGDIRDLWVQRKNELKQDVGNVTSRLADAIALLEVTKAVIEGACNFPKVAEDPFKDIRVNAFRSQDDSNQAQHARDRLIEQYQFNRHSFAGQGKVQPNGGWSGLHLSGTGEILFSRQYVDRFLRENDFDRGSVIEGWKDQGMIVTEKGRPNTPVYRKSFNGDRFAGYMFVLKEDEV